MSAVGSAERKGPTDTVGPFLSADPTADIRNTRKLGRVCDPKALLKAVPGR